MKAPSKILVLTDGSPCAQEATRVATGLSKALSAELCLAYFFDPFKYALPEGFVVYTPTQLTSMLQEFDKVLVKAAEAAREGGAQRVTTRVVQGAIDLDLKALVEEKGFDLIVIGTHGRTGVLHAVLGSVAEKVVRSAPCPVLTVKAPASA